MSAGKIFIQSGKCKQKRKKMMGGWKRESATNLVALHQTQDFL